MTDVGVADLAGKRLLVVGDVMLDEYVAGDSRRLSPEAPVPVVELTARRKVLGGAANAALNAASLGARVELVGVAGEDEDADRLASLLARSEIECDVVRATDRPTTVKTRVLANGQQVVRVDHEVATPISQPTEEEVLRCIGDRAPDADGVLLSDYAKGVLSESVAQGAIAAAEAGTPIVVDPKAPDFARFRGASVVTPNRRELSEALARSGATTDDWTALDPLFDLTCGAAILATLGAEGMSLFRRGADAIRIPTRARRVFDVTGAGDTVAATLAVALAAGWELQTAARLANAAAGIVVGRAGTATVDTADLAELDRLDLW